MARHRGTVYREIKRNQAPPCSVPHKRYLLTLVDRKTSFTIIGKLTARTVDATHWGNSLSRRTRLPGSSHQPCWLGRSAYSRRSFGSSSTGWAKG
ncbi:MAG: hypothetical protein GWP44_01240, partial [Proteobacteria bacterium]|nr:hypothetical protein [Pseudomonadota bacterium]